MDFLQIDDKRRERRVTIATLCKEIGVDESTYHKWKADPTKMKVETLIKIADYLEMSEEEKISLLQ